MCKHLLKIQRLILALLIFGGGIFYASSATARVCFLPDSTDCGEGDVDVPEVQITCATYGGYETEAACLEARTNKTAQTCTLNSGCYYPKCAYDSERKCKNENPDKKCLSQDVDGVKCWYSQPKTCSEQGYKNTPCTNDEDSGTVPNTLEASDGPCYKCTPKKECKYISNLYYGPKDTCPQYTDRKDAGVTGKDGVCSTCEPQACSAINAAYKNAANQNTCGSDKEAKKVEGTDSAADGPCYTCEDKPAGCTYEYTRVTFSETHGDSTFSSSLYSYFQNRAQNTRGASYYWNRSGSFEQNYDYSGFQMYSKIDKNSKSCQKDNGVTAYETICPGTARVACKKKFVPNGCSSEQYVLYRLTVEGTDFGDCICDTSKGLYDTVGECEKANEGASLKCTGKGMCYQTCEAAGMYSTEEACKTNAPKYTKCNPYGSCYKRDKPGWGIHYGANYEKAYDRTYICYDNGIPMDTDWTVSVLVRNKNFTNSWKDAEDLNGDTYTYIHNAKGELRYPAGEYKINIGTRYERYMYVNRMTLRKGSGEYCIYEWNSHAKRYDFETTGDFCSATVVWPGGNIIGILATFEEGEEYYVTASMSPRGYECKLKKYVYPNHQNVVTGGVDLSPPFVFYASTLDVILQRLMPLYRLRQSGESTTLLPTATHIDIAAAMALKPTQFFRFSTPVILGLVPRIFWQQTPNQVNKLALLLHKEYAYTRLSGQAR